MPFWFAACVGCPIREPAAPAIWRNQCVTYRWQGSSRSSTDFRRSERNVACLGAYELGVSPFWLGLIAIAACLGHIWPVFFGFKGGKGVATAFGAIAPIGWDLTGVMAGTWLLTVLLSGYSSLGAIVSALIAPFYVWWFKPQFTFPVSMLSCLILLRHHDNIQRLWRRQETKIWTKFKRKREKDPE